MADINFPSTAGGDAIVKQYTSINIKSGDNVSVDDTCKGLIIYCTGDCTINGSLTMSRKAGTANNSPVPSDGLRWTFYDGEKVHFLYKKAPAAMITRKTCVFYNKTGACGTADTQKKIYCTQCM